MLTIRISLRFNAAPLSYKGLYFEYGNDVTSKKEQFIIQNLVGRDNWHFINVHFIFEFCVNDFTKYFVWIWKQFQSRRERNNIELLLWRHVITIFEI